MGSWPAATDKERGKRIRDPIEETACCLASEALYAGLEESDTDEEHVKEEDDKNGARCGMQRALQRLDYR